MDIVDTKLMNPQFCKGLMLVMKKYYWDGFKVRKNKENLVVSFSSGDQEYLSRASGE